MPLGVVRGYRIDERVIPHVNSCTIYYGLSTVLLTIPPSAFRGQIDLYDSGQME